MENSPVLSVHHLKKKIGNKEIIKDISFEVYAGEVFGFLGPNGSGKTTTIRMLVDLIRPTEGRVYCCGKDVHQHHQEALKHIGCIVENPEMYPYMTGWENLEHFAAMLEQVGTKRIQEVVTIVGLTQRIHDKVKTYSLGMRQRLGIAQALLGNPKLLILDEPTNGLDPQGIKELREFIRGLANEGMSIFVSSHLLSEIQLLCDRVAIISKGRLLAVDRVDALLMQQSDQWTWKFEPFATGLNVLDELQYTERKLFPDGQSVLIRMPREAVSECNRRLVEAGVRVLGIEWKPPALEDLFLEMTEGEVID